MEVKVLQASRASLNSSDGRKEVDLAARRLEISLRSLRRCLEERVKGDVKKLKRKVKTS